MACLLYAQCTDEQCLTSHSIIIYYDISNAKRLPISAVSSKIIKLSLSHGLSSAIIQGTSFYWVIFSGGAIDHSIRKCQCIQRSALFPGRADGD